MRIAVIGGGVSGLAAAYQLTKLQPDASIFLYEKEAHTGGKIATSSKDSFLYEHGPNGFMNSRQEMLDLCCELGLEEEMLSANQEAAERFLMRDGKLNPLPKGPLQLFSWKGLSALGKLRLLKEIFTSPGTDDEENLYDFSCRHFGREVADYIVDPFTTGVYGTASKNLEVKAIFPLLHELDRDKGSLLRGAIAKRKKNKSSKGPKKSRSSLTSFSSGMQLLVSALKEKLETKIEFKTNAEIVNISKCGTLTLKEDEREISQNFDAILTTCPADALADICQNDFPKTATAARAIPYTPMLVVACGFKKVEDYQGPKGFGYLVPPKENSAVLGLLLSSFIYQGRAPQEGLLTRLMIGGDRLPEAVNWPDSKIADLAKEEIKTVLGIEQEPDMLEIVRWPKAIPAYTAGHSQRVATIVQETKNSPLFISGNAFTGVSMNDCIKNSFAIAEEISASLKKLK